MYDIRFPNLGIVLKNIKDGFTIFGFEIKFYGVIIALGFVLAFLVISKEAKRTGQSEDTYLDFMLWLIIPAILGARLYYIIFSWDSYFQKGKGFGKTLFDLIDIRSGGLAIYGGVIAGVIVAIVFAKKQKMKFSVLADTVTMGLLIGQIMGRWGNFFNQEAFGCNTNSIFGMSGGRIQEWITDQYPSTTYFANFGTALDASQPVHPCFLYESVWCLLGFVLLALFAKKIRRYDGQIFLIYICWYGAERAVVEGLRTDSLVIGNVRVSQILAICCVVVSVILQIAIGTKVKRMGVDYHMYKDTAESKRMLAEYEAGKTGADTAEDSESNETESTDDTTDTTTEADASDASADNDDTATENCENENEKE